MLAVVFTCQRFHQCIYGKKVQIENDHKPPGSIMKKSMQNTPPRMQRMLLTLQKYDMQLNNREKQHIGRHFIKCKSERNNRRYSRRRIRSTSSHGLQKCSSNTCQDEGNSRRDSKRFLFDEDCKICY